MYKVLSIALTYTCLCSCNNQNNTTTHNPFTDSLTHQLNQVHKGNSFNGFSVAIVNEKGTLYKAGIGFANKAINTPYTENTIQNIGSISKTLVGIALLKAQELGKLDIDDPINKYLPFKVENPFYANFPITIRHLTTHTSTITDNEYYGKTNYVLKPNQDLTNVKMALDDEQSFISFDSILTMPVYLKNVLSKDGRWYSKKDFLNNKPGELFEYSNVATSLAAYIVELATGESFNKFTAKHILQPLQMNSSGWNFGEIDLKQHSRLYYTTDTLLPFYSLVTYPDGNFITSSNDLAKFLSELIKGYNGIGTILNKESYKQYFTTQLSANNFTNRNEKNPYSDEYNMGTFIGHSVAGNIGHTGGDPGVSTIMFFNPKTKIGRLLIVNTNINDKKGNDEFYKIWNTLEEYQDKF